MFGSGTSITLRNGSEARVGLVVANEYGELFALTTRDFLWAAEEGVYSGDDGATRVGTRVMRWYSDHEHWQGARAFAWFAIDKEVEVRSDNLAAYSVALAEDAFTQDVVVDCAASKHATGYVRRVNSTLDVIYPDQTKLHVNSRLCEVEPDSSEVGFGRPGDAGALVCTSEGELLGCLVGFRDGRTLVAPLQDFFASESFHIATLEEIRAHNEAAKEKPIELQVVERIRKSKKPWWREVRALASQTNSEFSRLYRINISEMETCQNKITVSIYRLVGATKFINGLLRLHIENDAPGSSPNDNWLWRAAFERERLFHISENAGCFVVPGTSDEICPTILKREATVVSPVAQFDNEGPISRQEYEGLSVEDQAALVFGENVMFTNRAMHWFAE